MMSVILEIKPKVEISFRPMRCDTESAGIQSLILYGCISLNIIITLKRQNIVEG
jgi:hypothetical protein